MVGEPIPQFVENRGVPETTTEPDNDFWSSPLRKELYDKDSPYYNLDTLLEEEVERETKFKDLFDEISQDGDLIADSSFLQKIQDFRPIQRIEIAAKAGSHIYIGANDFKEYFDRFPEDARIANYAVETGVFGYEHPYEEAIIWAIGTKMLEEAAKHVPGQWAFYQRCLKDPNSYLKPLSYSGNNSILIPKYLEICDRSNYARASLLGDYKNNFNLESFNVFGEEISSTIRDLFYRADNLYNHVDWGYVSPNMEIFQSPNYISLPDTDKAILLQKIIENAHNMLVFHEVYNSAFDQRARLPRPISGQDRQVIGRGLHSIIFGTDHSSSAYGAESLRGFVKYPVFRQRVCT